MPSPINGTSGDDILTGTPGDDVINGLGGNDVIRGGGGSDQLHGGLDSDNIDGGNGDDQLYGDEGDDYLRGGPGDDLIDGGAGLDRAAYFTAPAGVTVDLRIQDGSAQDTGSAGHDTLLNIENLSGSIYSDTLYGNDGDNWIWALGPTGGVTPTNDNLYGFGGNDLLQVGTGDHILDGGTGTDTVNFGVPGDILYATPDPGNGLGNGIVIDLFAEGGPQDTRQGMMTLIGIENVSGSVLDDVMNGDNNANVIAGDAGDDQLFGLGGNDTIYGDGAIGVDAGIGNSGPITTFTADQGTGVDFYDAAGRQVFTFNGQPLYDAAGNLLTADVSTNPDDPYTHYNVNGVDYYFYVGNPTTSDGVVGNDVIDGGAGDDMLYGGGGNDLLHGGRGASSGNDLLDGGDGDDYLTGGAGNDTIIGGAGIDRAGYFTSTGGVGVSVDLRIVGVAQNTGSQGMDTLSGIENLSGTTFADTLTGDDGDNWLWGSTANFNHVFSATNNDTINGMGGNDLITVGIGNQVADGGTGNDTLRFTENGGIVENGITVSLALQGSAQATGYGNWTLSNFENLSGGQGNDHLTGDGGDNRLTGEGGDDTLDGGGGNDILSGDATYDADTHGLGYSGAARLLFDPDAAPGNDHLDGGTGDDTALFLLAPGAGTLTLGHDGADLLILRGAETVARISFAGDVVTVAGLNSGSQLGTDTLVNIEHLSFQIDGGGAPLVVDLSGGVVVDGYVAGGTVFADANSNGVLDAGEAFTTTDANGNFTLGGGSGPLVMFGGTNVDTGLPNLVTLTAPEGSTVVNPLTTLVETLVAGGATPGDAQDAVAAAFGIDTGVDLTSFDPLAAPPGDADALAVQQASAAVVVLVLAGSDAAGGGDTNENAVFDALADAIAGAGGGTVDLTDSSAVTNILTDALPAGTDVTGAAQAISDAATAIDGAADLAGVAAAQEDALNDPPVVTVAASFAATEQQALDLKHMMSVADADAGSGTVTATLSVGYGVIHVDVGTSGASIASGNDSDTVTLTGTVAELNALLDGDATSVVSYTADTDIPPATTQLTLGVDDGGNSGAGGALTGSDSGTIDITAVNDAPVLSNYDNVIAASGIGPIDLRIGAPVDPDGDPLTITLTGVPSYGTVEYFDGAAWIAAAGGETLTSAELVSLRYTPPASGEFGGETIAYSVDDGTATVHGTIDVTSHVVTPDPLLLLFAASNDNSHNPDLYTVDSAGVLHAVPVNAPNGSFAGDGSGFIQFGGDTYFTAANSVASFGGIFKMDPGGTATLLDAGGGAFFGSQIGTNPHLTLFAGGLYFAGDVDGAGSVAIRLETDGSHTSFDLNGNNQNFAGANGGFVEFDGSLYFSAVTTLTNGNQSPDLIRLDQDGSTTEISTRSAPNAAFGSFAGEDGGFIAYNGALYFNAYDDTLGDTLFRLDAGSTTPVAVGSGTLSHLFGGTDSGFHVFAGSLYFNEFSYASGAESLFKLDPSGTLTEIQYLNSSAALEPLADAGANGGFIDFGGATFFTARTSDTGLDLFRLDSCGCLQAIDFNLGPADAFDINLPAHFTLFGGALYFDAYDDASGSDHLYKLTADGFLDPVDLGGGGTTHAGVEGGFQQAFGSLFFSAYTGDGYEIVRLEPDGSYTTTDINPGPGGNSIIPGDGQTFGLLNGNPLTGGAGNDIIAGSAATETLSGGAGNDVLESRGGNDHLAGGDGGDLFVLFQAGAANLVTLDDYDFPSGDTVDLSALLDAGFGPNSNVADFVRLFAVDGDIKLQIDADGPANGTHWTDVAILAGGNSLFLDTVEVHFNNADYVLTESFQFNLQTISLAGGGWAVTWTEASYEAGDVFDNVFGRVFDAGGHQVGGTFQVSATDNGMDDQNNLTVALPNGDFAAVWQACDNEIWTRVYHADGTPATAPEAVQPPDPDVAAVLPGGIIALSSGGYAVLWQQADSPANGGDNVYFSIFAADGTPVSGPVPVNAAGSHDDDLTTNFGPLAIAESTQIVKLADGFAVAWLSGRDTGPGGGHETSVFVSVFDDAGNPVTGEIQANSADSGVSSVDGGFFDFQPQLVALGGNDFAVQWESDSSGGDDRMFARIFDDADYTGGAPVRLDANADPLVLAQTWDATPLVNGGFVALWGQYDTSDPGTPSDVYIQVFDAAGAIAAGSGPGGLVVNQVSNVVNLPDQVLALTGGGFAILYDSVRDDGVGAGSDEDVYVRTYAADGTPVSNEVRVNPADDIDNGGLALAALPNGGFVVLWAQGADTANGARTDIFARIIGADGLPFGGPILVGSTPSDLSYPQELSLIEEFRDAVSANGEILTATITTDTVDLTNFVNALSIALMPRPPVVDLNTGTTGIDDFNLYAEGDAGSGIGAAIGISVGHAGDMIHGATVAISDPETGDQLFVNLPLPGGITVDTANSTDDVLVLIGTASAADYADALGQVGFRSSSDDPTAGGTHNDRSIGVTVDDGTHVSSPATMTMTVVGINDAPTLTATGQDPTYTENGAAVGLFGAAAASTVEANQTLTSLTVTVINVTDGANELLGIDGSSLALTNGNSVTTATHGLIVGVSLSGTTATVTFSGTTLSAADLQTLVDNLAYANASETPTAASRTVTITEIVDSGSNVAPSEAVTALSIGSTVQVVAVNDAPAFAALDGTPSFIEGGAAVVLDSNATVIDADLTATDYAGATLTLARSGGASAQDLFGGTGGAGLTLAGGNASVNGTTIGSFTQSGGTLVITFNSSATQALVNGALQGITYSNSSDNPPASAVIAYTFDDGNSGAQGSGSALTASGSVTVSITGVDDTPLAVADSYATNEDAVLTVAAAGVLANDTDPDGGPKLVASVNGNVANVGVAVTLPSGAKVTLNADGSLTYDPNGQFNTLTSTASGETGAVNTSALDSFTYAVNGGSGTTVTVTVNGVVSGQDHLEGDGTDNTITGTPSGDFFDLSQGGNDNATGLGANDGFYFGAAFTALDHVDGGAGTNDQIGLKGDYTGANALVLGANTIANIEAIVLLPGVGPGYDITTNDGNVAAGGLLKVQGTQLGVGQSFRFDGSAEHDGSFIVYGHQGTDVMIGGDGNDGFYFGPNAFGSGDTVDGGPGGNDQLGLDGSYGAFGPAFVLGGNVTNVEVVVLLPGPSGSPNNFNLTTNDGFVPAGQTETIFGLQVTTDILFDGSHEHDGAFRLYGGSGNDVFTASAGNDWIFGGGGGDLLTGGLGSDTFFYDAASQSTSLGYDKIFNFDDSTDTIDLPFAVTGFAAPASGSLSTASFDSDLATAFAGLTSHQAGMFTATGGDLNGHTFLVVDGNGTAGYQAGSDYVIEIVTPVTPVDNPAIFV